MTEFTLSTLRATYLQNLPYYYPLQTYDPRYGGWYTHPVNTGWQVAPNILWSHYVSPRQFYEMIIKYEAIKVVGASMTVFNMIPIQSTLAIQGTTTFNAFNNTIYGWGYNDKFYETPPFNWGEYYRADNQLYSMYHEGAYPTVTNKPEQYNAPEKVYNTGWTFPNSSEKKLNPEPSDLWKVKLTRQRWPLYYYKFPFGKPTNRQINSNDPRAWIDEMCIIPGKATGYSAAIWDPLNRPHDLMELRPGKNAIKFSWSAHPTDQNHWFNTDAIALLWPYKRDGPYNVRMQGSSDYWKPNEVDPQDYGNRVIDPNPRGVDRQGGSYDNGAGISPPEGWPAQHARDACVYPWSYTNVPDWAGLPIVPVQWWNKEIEESNLWSKQYWRINSDQIGTYLNQEPVDWELLDNDSPSVRAAEWAKVRQQVRSIVWPGTEFENYKYPPTQWFMKLVPLFDSSDALIVLEAQVFYLLELHIIGKPRESAIYAPTWGPFSAQSLYSADPHAKYNLSTIRGRSGGARRTWMATTSMSAHPEQDIPETTATAGSTDVPKKNVGGADRIKDPGEPSYWCRSQTNPSNDPDIYDKNRPC